MATAAEAAVVHSGQCHCGAVKWTVVAPAELLVWKCNCSICKMKSNDHFIVPKSAFTLLQGEDALTTYTFNTHVAKHTFCKICGVQSFYSPRSNPDGYGVNPNCIVSDTVAGIRYSHFDGQHWEEYLAKSGIQELSKAADGQAGELEPVVSEEASAPAAS